MDGGYTERKAKNTRGRLLQIGYGTLSKKGEYLDGIAYWTVIERKKGFRIKGFRIKALHVVLNCIERFGNIKIT